MTSLTARHSQTEAGPLVALNGLPALDSNMTPAELLELARQIKYAATDALQGAEGMRRYPEQEPHHVQSN